MYYPSIRYDMFHLAQSGNPELIPNGSAAVDTASWAGNVNTTISRETNFNGEATCFKGTAIGTSSVALITTMLGDQVDSGEDYDFTFKVYIPSSNTSGDRYRLRLTTPTSQYVTSAIAPTPDTWVTVNASGYTATGDSSDFIIYLYDGTVPTGITIGDVFYITAITGVKV